MLAARSVTAEGSSRHSVSGYPELRCAAERSEKLRLPVRAGAARSNVTEIAYSPQPAIYLGDTPHGSCGFFLPRGRTCVMCVD